MRNTIMTVIVHIFFCESIHNLKIQLFILRRLKSHHVEEDNSESDDDEFTGKGIVYDSDEEEDGPSDDNLTSDKKKVLTFFNDGGDQELTGIQGCNKKKVIEIVKLRPFEVNTENH